MNNRKHIWMPLFLLLPLLLTATACHHRLQYENGILFPDDQVQERWEQAQEAVLSAQDVEPQVLPSVIPVWLALGHHQAAKAEIERLAGRIDSLQPSETLARMAYDVSVFANDSAWTHCYAEPIIRKCAEYYRNGGSDGSDAATTGSAQYCFERMVLANLDEHGEYARLLLDGPSGQPTPRVGRGDMEELLQSSESQSASLADEARVAQALISSMVSNSHDHLEIARGYDWEGDVQFNGIYSILGIKVSGTVVSRLVDVKIEAWRDADFMLLGERIRLQKGQKVERSFHL